MATAPLVYLFVDDINKVIDKYRDQGITISELVGALELIKLDIVNDQRELNSLPDVEL